MHSGRLGDRSVGVHKYFDYETAASQAGLSAEDLAALRRRVESDYPSPRLRERRLVALCKAIGKGECTLGDALQPPDGEFPGPAKLRMGG